METSISKSPLEIYLLGVFQVKINGVPLEPNRWKRRSSAKLVKLLSLAPHHRMLRDLIIETLWGDQYSENLTNNLNKAIHSARRVLEPELTRAADSQFIKTENHQISLQTPVGHVFVDAREFERLSAEGIKMGDPAICERALELYKGDLLTEDIYEDWVMARREHLRQLYRKLVTKTAEIYAGKEQHERSIELLNQLSLSDPTDERVHQELMRLFVLTGSKYQALKQFDRCRRALSEIGLVPENKTLEIKEQIQAGRILPLPKNSAAAALNRPAVDYRQAGAGREALRIKNFTFHHGVVHTARFLPDGENIIYSAAWEENEFEIYKTRRQSLESEPTGISRAGIFSVSPRGEIAVSLDRRFIRGYKSSGTLARMNFRGGATFEILEKVQYADWHPLKSVEPNAKVAERLAAVRNINGRNHLEYPLGTVIFETGGWISHPRFSPRGDKIAFIYHPTQDDDSGQIVVMELGGQPKILTGTWLSAQGLAWHGSGKEIWFTATREGNLRAIYAIDLKGNERFIYKATGSITLQDLADDNAVLMTLNKTQIKIAAKAAGNEKERDLTWHDWSLVRDISSDGADILFTEAGESGGRYYAAYVRKIDGSETVRIGEGSALAFSPDGKYALVKSGAAPQQLAVCAIAGGETKLLKRFDSDSIFYQPWACWFPDGESILFAANETASATKLYVQKLDGEPVCLTPEIEGFELSTPHAIAPGGRTAAVIHPDKKIYLYDFEASKLVPIPELAPNFMPVGWSADGRQLFIRERGQFPAVIFSYDLASRKQQTLFVLCPQYRAGVHEILRILVTPDRNAYAYSYTREFSDLMVIEGLC